MWLQLSITLLVATSCAYALTKQEAQQFTIAGGCTPANGFIGAELFVSYSNGVTRIRANHIPNHIWDKVNPNTPTAPEILHEYTFNPPVYHSDRNVSCLPQGPIGIAKNGVYIFNPTTGGGGNAKTEEIMGRNGGHSTPFGEYHYHYLPENGTIWDSRNPRSQFIGIAFDGFPIYSIGRGVDVNKLDICHGMRVQGEYRYIASPDHFPYFLGCFRGTNQVKRSPKAAVDCSGVTRNKACTCDFCVIEVSKKRAVVDLLRRLLRETGDQPSLRSKRAVGSCGTNMSSDQSALNFGQTPVGPPPNEGGAGPPPNGGGPPPMGGGPPPMGGGYGPPPNGGGGGGPPPRPDNSRCRLQQGDDDGNDQTQQAGDDQSQEEDNDQPQQDNNGWSGYGFNSGWFGRRPQYDGYQSGGSASRGWLSGWW